jgi:origin recognition complex subunit 1
MTSPQTPRRSKRHHPNVFTANNPSSFSRPHDDKWASPPSHTRSTINADLVDDEQPTDHASTTFYPDFVRSYRVADKGGKATSDKFSIGDTVLLATNARRPSIGVIIALWQVSRAETDLQMLARVHWFIRPTELAQSRAKREHLEVRLLVLTVYICRTWYLSPE